MYVCVCVCHDYHQNMMMLAEISLLLCKHSSLSSIASGRSSEVHPVSIQSCCR